MEPASTARTAWKARNRRSGSRDPGIQLGCGNDVARGGCGLFRGVDGCGLRCAACKARGSRGKAGRADSREEIDGVTVTWSPCIDRMKRRANRAAPDRRRGAESCAAYRRRMRRVGPRVGVFPRSALHPGSVKDASCLAARPIHTGWASLAVPRTARTRLLWHTLPRGNRFEGCKGRGCVQGL